jgi:hypothetical protein
MYMKQDTNVIYSHLDKIYKKNKDYFRPVTFTNEGNNMIRELFRNIHSCNQQWNLEQNKIQITPFAELPKSPDFDYMPQLIRAEIDRKCGKRISCVIPFQNRTFTVYLCMSSTMSNDVIERRIKQIYLWLCLANRYVRPSCSKTVDIYIYFIDLKKSLPIQNDHPIDQVHVNTAFTTTCQPHTNVHIFREEEWFRALIHESFHNLGLDFILMDQKFHKIAENRLRSIFPVTMPEIRFYETYCEMWGEILNCMFIVYLFECSSKTFSIQRCLVSLKEMLLYEKMFSVLQCVKVLHHNKLNYCDMMNEFHASNYKERTQGFAYYVLKSIYMVHVSQFLHFCATQSSSYSLQFRLNMKTLKNYTDIIENNYNSNDMIESTLLMKRELLKSNGIMKKTLRMSLWELE